MFKSSFAREILESAQNNNDEVAASSILPKERHTIYKSNFAASTHSPMDYITPDTLEFGGGGGGGGNGTGNNGGGGGAPPPPPSQNSRYPLPSRNCNVSNYRGGGVTNYRGGGGGHASSGGEDHGELTTSDLGTLTTID